MRELTAGRRLINGFDIAVSKCYIRTGILENFGLPIPDDIHGRPRGYPALGCRRPGLPGARTTPLCPQGHISWLTPFLLKGCTAVASPQSSLQTPRPSDSFPFGLCEVCVLFCFKALMILLLTDVCKCAVLYG